MRTGAALTLSALLGGCTGALNSRITPPAPIIDPIATGFRNPPHTAKPQTWWHWMNGNIDAREAVADLEWAAQQDIGGVHVFQGGLGATQVVDKRLPYMSGDWQGALRASVAAADRLGLDFSIPTSPGWSATGGPWVTPAQAMKKLVWSETRVRRGGGRIRLSNPPAIAGPFQDVPADQPAPSFYRDVAVLAFPADPPVAKPVITTSSPIDQALLRDGSFGPSVRLMPDRTGNATIVYRLPKPTRVMAVRVGLPAPHGFGAPPPPTAFVETSDDGRHWQKLADVPASTAPARTVSFAPIVARWFRLTVRLPETAGFLDALSHEPGSARLKLPPIPPGFAVSEFDLLTGPTVNAAEVKAGFATTPDYFALHSAPSRGIALDTVIDLSDRLKPDGTLDWLPPPGPWTVIRFGMGLTGRHNGPAPEEATGLEVDKLSAQHVRSYLDKYLGDYDAAVATSGPINGLLSDSIEAGAQNWTDEMPAQFRSRRGYDLRKFLPVLAGHVVGDTSRSDAFLYDFRRTISDLLTDAHYGTIAKAAKSRGMTYYAEALEDHRPQLGNDLAMRAVADVPAGAMWFFEPGTAPRSTYVADLKGAASVAHVLGKSLVGVEALTSFGYPWALTPGRMRATADQAFLLGGTRLMLHSMVHQAAGDRVFPGQTLIPQLGHNFNRNENWALLARGCIDYLARSQFLLQQGTPTADFAYFIGEESPVTGLYGDSPPAGISSNLSYDFVDDVLLDRLQYSDGKLRNAGGGSYAFIFLGGSSSRMTLSTLGRLEAMAAKGVIIAGRPPTSSPSLTDAGAEFTRRVAALWQHPNVITAATPDEARDRLRVAPAWNYTGSGAIGVLRRSVPSGNIFYIVNQSSTPASGVLQIGQLRGQAQWWNAALATVEGATLTNGGIAIELGANESHFLVVREGVAPVSSWSERQTVALTSDWSVTLNSRNRAPVNLRMKALSALNRAVDPAVRNFSGTATYRATLQGPPKSECRNPRTWLEFQAVGDVGRVTLNGAPLGYLWTRPYRVDATDALRNGSNQLTVEVANSWKNRLVADARSGDATALTFYDPEAPLSEAGLSGELRLVERCPN